MEAHARAMSALETVFDFANPLNESAGRAEFFASEALLPLETARFAPTEVARLLHQRSETLRLYAAALAQGELRLKREVSRRKAGDLVIRKGREQRKILLHDSKVILRKLAKLVSRLSIAEILAPCSGPALVKCPGNPSNPPRNRDGRLKANPNRLTPRESEILQLIAGGEPNKHIAGTLGISIKTVEKHRQNLMTKLGIHHTAGLTRYAIAAGLLSPA